MATARIQIDEGATTNLATNSFTEDAVTKHISRSALNNSSGTEIGTNANPLQIGDAGGTLTVDGTVAVSSITTSITPGTAAANLGKAEDAAHTSGDVGVMALTVRQDTAAALGGTDADYQPLITDGSGRLHVNVGNTVTVGSHAVTNAGTFAVQVSGDALTALQLIDNLVLAEDAVHGNGDPGVQALAVRKDSGTSIAASDGDYSPLQVDASGNLRVNIAAGSSAGTEYTEDAASAADPAGGMLIARRRDALSGTEVSADGDNIALNSSSKGELYVKHTDTLAVSVASLPSHAVTNAGTFVVQVDGAALTALQLIDDAIQTEDAAASGGEKGVQVLAVRRDAAASSSGTDGDFSTLNTDANGRLYVASDTHAVTQSGTWNIGTVTTITNVVPVSDNAGSLTVDAPVGTPVFVRLSDGSAAISTLPVSLATVPSHAVTNAGTFAVQVDGNALTALQLIDDVVLAEDAVHSSGDKGVMALAVRCDTPAAKSADGDYIPLITDSVGRQHVAHSSTGKTILSAGGSASSSGNNTIVAAGSARLKVFGFSLSMASATAVTCIFQSGAGGTELWRVILQAPSSVSTGANLVVTPPAWLFATASATLLNLNLSAAVAVNWSVSYFDES